MGTDGNNSFKERMKLIRSALTLVKPKEEESDEPTAPAYRFVLSDSSALDEMVIRLYQSLLGERKRQFWQIRGTAFDKLLFLTEHGRDPKRKV